jgi:hypothetical protein
MQHDDLSRRSKLDLVDRLAIALSALCVVHCLGTALVVGAFAVAGAAFSHDVHSLALAIALLLGILALGGGLLRHGRLGPSLIGGAGLALMAGALAVGHGSLEVMLTLFGVTLLAFAHYRNGRVVA